MFEVSVAVDNIIDWITSMPILNSVAKNPIYTALLITVCILIIVLVVYRNVESDESLLMLGVRASFYTFIAVLFVIFLHNHILLGEISHSDRGEGIGELFRGSAETAGYREIAVPVRGYAPSVGSMPHASAYGSPMAFDSATLNTQIMGQPMAAQAI
jgi:hypothetical protein